MPPIGDSTLAKLAARAPDPAAPAAAAVSASGGGLDRNGLDWNGVEAKTITMFYPAQASFEWIHKGREHGGARAFTRGGDRCSECHAREVKDMGAKIASGQKAEATPIAGKRPFVDLAVQAAHDGKKVHFRFQWRNGPHTPAPFAEDQPAISPISPYAASKRAGELLVHAFGHLYPLQIINLRFFTVYGPRQRPDLAIHKFTDLIARGHPVRMHGDGSSERDYTYITDCLDGILSALRWTATAAPGTVETVNLGGGERVRLDRLIALIAETLGQEARIERHVGVALGDRRQWIAFVEADHERMQAPADRVVVERAHEHAKHSDVVVRGRGEAGVAVGEVGPRLG